MLIPKGFVAATLMMVILAVNAAEAAAERFDLKDGTTLFIQSDGTMRMIDPHGKSISMSDGVEMAMTDGRTLMMKNRRVWLRIGPPGKGYRYLRTD